MAQYEDFITDFPARCLEILKATDHEVVKSYEVTLLLMMATAGFTIPFERLLDTHPAWNILGDDYSDIHEVVNEPGPPFKRTHLYYSDKYCWKWGTTSEIKGDPSTWRQLVVSGSNIQGRRALIDTPYGIPEKLKLRKVLKHIRNSLSHGNIFTENDAGKIKSIILASECRFREPEFGYQFLSVSPRAFRHFLSGWFNMLGTDGETLNWLQEHFPVIDQ